MAAGMGGGLGMFTQLLGGISKAFGSYQQGQAQAASFESQAAAYQANARIAQMNATAALDAGQQSKERRERLGRAKLGSTATKYLKSGVTLVGSPLAVLGEEAAQEALAAEDELYEGKIKANQYENQAKMHQFNAARAQSQADYASSSAGSSLFSSISSGIGGMFSG